MLPVCYATGFTTLRYLIREGESIIFHDSIGGYDGHMAISHFEVIDSDDLIELFKKGVTIRQHIAIDFTGSNGKPTSPHSLHHLQSG